MDVLNKILDYYNSRPYTHLSEKAYDIIVELIITLQLKPGVIYSEGDLIELSGIGRTPIREAIKRLEFINILSVLPRSGIQIAGLQSEDFQFEREMRCAIEALIIKKTARSAFPNERKHLRELMEAHDQFFKDQDYLGIIRTDLQFHLSVAAYARNSYAQNALLPFLISECRLFFLYATSSETPMNKYNDLHQKHVQMMQCIIDGDGDAACSCLRQATFRPEAT